MSVANMSASMQYWNHQYNAYQNTYRAGANEEQRDSVGFDVSSLCLPSPRDDFNGQSHYPAFNNAPPSYIKEEPNYDSCRYSINQMYSNNLAFQSDNSITPPPPPPPPQMNHNFIQHLTHSFDSCQQTAYNNQLMTNLPANEPILQRPDGNEEVKKTDDSPALRALLTKPARKKAVTENYFSLKKTNAISEYQHTFYPSSFTKDNNDNTSHLQEVDKSDDLTVPQADQTHPGNLTDSSEDNNSTSELTSANFYPWMKTSNG